MNEHLSERDAGLSLAYLVGIRHSYFDSGGVERWSSDEAIVGALRGIGYAIDTDWTGSRSALSDAQRSTRDRCVDPVLVMSCPYEGLIDVQLDLPAGLQWRIEGEGDFRCEGEGRVHVELGCGLYDLLIGSGDDFERSVLVCAPARGYREAGDVKAGCLIAPLWAVHNGDDFDVGHFGHLAELGDMAEKFECSVIGTLPVFAGYLAPEDWAGGRADPCPYAPVSRYRLNELHVDPLVVREQCGGETASRVASVLAGVSSNRGSHVDWRAVSERVHGLFDMCVAERRSKSSALPWRDWDDGSVESFARMRHRGCAPGDEAIVDRHMLGQWLAELSFSRARAHMHGIGKRLYLDLPIGMHPHGHEATEHEAWLMSGSSIGAPPDAAFANGQDWSSPAPLPVWVPGVERSNAGMDELGAFRSLCSSVMSRCDVLRIDHVLGLQRLWVIPDGNVATDGVYVGRPLAALCAIARLESHRHRCRLVGEDLGTVDPPVRAEMDSSGFSRLVVGQLSVGEERVEVPHESVAGVGTHDFPPWGAFWSCSDLEARERFGIIDSGGVAWERGVRRAGLEQLGVDSLAAFVELSKRLSHGWGAAGAWMLVVSLSDVIGDEALVNVPGTVDGGHWSARLSLALDEMSESDEVARWIRSGFGRS